MRLQAGQNESFVGERASCSIAEGMFEPHAEQLLFCMSVTAIPPEDFRKFSYIGNSRILELVNNASRSPWSEEIVDSRLVFSTERTSLSVCF